MLHKDGAYRCILKGQIYVSKVAVKVAALEPDTYSSVWGRC